MKIVIHGFAKEGKTTMAFWLAYKIYSELGIVTEVEDQEELTNADVQSIISKLSNAKEILNKSVSGKEISISVKQFPRSAELKRKL